MSRKVPVAKTDDVPPGEGRSFELEQRVVAVFNIDGEFTAINDACPHMGASLSAGSLEGCVVTCPLHAWRFNVRDGTWCDNPRVKTDHFPVTVEEGIIYVIVDN